MNNHVPSKLNDFQKKLFNLKQGPVNEKAIQEARQSISNQGLPIFIDRLITDAIQNPFPIINNDGFFFKTYSVTNSEAESQISKPNSKKKKNIVTWGAILLVPLVSIAVYLYIKYGSSPTPIPQKDRSGWYVIASGLYLRMAPNDNSGTADQIPYGTRLELINRPDYKWAEVKYNGLNYYVHQHYIAPYNDFVQMDNLAQNPEGKELLRESYFKTALFDYFTKHGYRISISPDDYEFIYHEKPDNTKIWEFTSSDQTKEYNSIIPSIKLESGEYGKNAKNLAIIILNKHKKENQRLITFRFLLKNGKQIPTEIASLDLQNCKDCGIKLADYSNFQNFQAQNSREQSAIDLNFRQGKNGIFIKGFNESYPTRVLFWKSLNKLEEFKITPKQVTPEIVIHPSGISGSGELKESGGFSYNFWNVVDPSLETWWTPSYPRNGLNAYITLHFLKEEWVNGLKVLPGSHQPSHPKWGDLFPKNNRVKKAEISFSDGSKVITYFTDEDKIQTISFPKKKTKTVQFKILEIYRGTEWNDLSISELRPIWNPNFAN